MEALPGLESRRAISYRISPLFLAFDDWLSFDLAPRSILEDSLDEDPIAPVESGPQWLPETHGPHPPTAEMSPDDDDNDGHFGFAYSPIWRSGSADSRDTMLAGSGRSSILSMMAREVEKRRWASPASNSANWRHDAQTPYPGLPGAENKSPMHLNLGSADVEVGKSRE